MALARLPARGPNARVSGSGPCQPGRLVRPAAAELAYPAVVPRVVIDVMLKPEIHDPQGDAIASACRRLGFSQVASVRQGKRFEIELTEPASGDQMAELASELLANPVIEEFAIEAAAQV